MRTVIDERRLIDAPPDAVRVAESRALDPIRRVRGAVDDRTCTARTRTDSGNRGCAGCNGIKERRIATASKQSGPRGKNLQVTAALKCSHLTDEQLWVLELRNRCGSRAENRSKDRQSRAECDPSLFKWSSRDRTGRRYGRCSSRNQFPENSRLSTRCAVARDAAKRMSRTKSSRPRGEAKGRFWRIPNWPAPEDCNEKKYMKKT